MEAARELKIREALAQALRGIRQSHHDSPHERWRSVIRKSFSRVLWLHKGPIHLPAAFRSQTYAICSQRCHFRRWRLPLSIAVLILFAALAPLSTSQATTYHVSPQGTNIPPYDSYETAAHHPREAISVASGPGDTILVHAGQYDVDTAIVVPRGLSLIGVDRDSVELTWCCWQDYVPKIMFDLEGDHRIAGITFRNAFTAASQAVAALFMSIAHGDVYIYECDFIQVFCDGSTWDTLEVYNNHFEVGSRFGVNTTSGSGTVLIHDNFFTGGLQAFSPTCVAAWWETIIIENNIFDLSESNFRGESVGVQEGWRPVTIRNNLMIGGDLAISWNRHSGVIENNTIVRTELTNIASIHVRLEVGDTLTVRNNLIIESPVAVFLNCDNCVPKPSIEYTHNRFWPPVTDFFITTGAGTGLQITDSANANAFPMVVDDSLYHLQAGSPLIDAGDPSILDADGSRSDIGWTGGPGGIIADYPELPPEDPDSIAADGMDGIVTIAWTASPEADLAGYRVYRGGESGFWSPSEPPHRVLDKLVTMFTDTVLIAGQSVYYVVTAFDTAGLESDPSVEVMQMITGVNDPDALIHTVPKQASILRIYPNPFNSEATIEIVVPGEVDSSENVRIELFDVLGRRVSTPVSTQLSAGSHFVPLRATDESGRALASGVYFAQLVIEGARAPETYKFVVLK